MIADNDQKENSENLILGQEWSDQSSFEKVVKDFIQPFCQNENANNVLEIGVGGGRVACEVSKLLK